MKAYEEILITVPDLKSKDISGLCSEHPPYKVLTAEGVVFIYKITREQSGRG